VSRPLIILNRFFVIFVVFRGGCPNRRTRLLGEKLHGNSSSCGNIIIIIIIVLAKAATITVAFDVKSSASSQAISQLYI